MELEKLFGLPAHPLLVHAPVVLVPLAAIAAVLIAVRPTWRVRSGWPTVVLCGVAAFMSLLAAGSGEALEESVDRSKLLHEHTELGDAMKLIAIVFFVVVLALKLADKYLAGDRGAAPGRHPVALGLAALTVVMAVFSTVWIVRVGHSGAKATWNDVKIGERPAREAGDDDGD